MNKYISTTLPYANSIPHMGHALEFIQASALQRFFKDIQKESVFFNVGVDENGLKVYSKAKEEGIDTQVFLDSLANKWIQFCKMFEIEYDNFYRTTSPIHHEKVKQFWNDSMERGDLYKKSYTGSYCQGCESFKTDSDLIDGKCPEHGIEPIITSEENWFFKIEKHKGLLIGWFEANKKEFLIPQNKVDELFNIILKAEDISVSRLKKNVPWGVEVPGDPDQVIYVWFEALLNYIFAPDVDFHPSGAYFKSKYFIQICGPDNLRFQGSLFQTILLSANLPNTKKLLVHGTILDADGKKMSKTMGNVIDPVLQLEKYGLDAVRYYALAGLSTTGNGSWSEVDLVKLYNNDLADNYGNLIARVLHLVDIKNIEYDYTKVDNAYVYELSKKFASVEIAWENFNINEALKETNAIVKSVNKYINDTTPWAEGSDYVQILNTVSQVLELITKFYFPVLSTETYTKIMKALQSRKKEIIFVKLK